MISKSLPDRRGEGPGRQGLNPIELDALLGYRRAVCFDVRMAGTSDVVKDFLRGQNLEQLGKVDDAVGLYERCVDAGFDSSGPYDRLIFIYADRARHHDVVRVAEAAIRQVVTYHDKIGWYERMRADALKAQSSVPKAAPKRRAE